MNNTPQVSVIVIFLNPGKFIEEAIESVLAQTYRSWELLLVDDGSTDASTEIARDYQARYPQKVLYLEHAGHQNRGMSASRNLGIAHASGELIAFLDADDLWLPDKLERQVAILQRHPEVGLLANPGLCCYQDGAKRAQAMTLQPGRLPQGALVPKMLEDDDNTPFPSAILMRKELAVRLGGFEEAFRGMFEDQVMWFKVTLGSSTYYDSNCCILYRVHADSLCSATPPVQQMEARVRCYAWLTDYLRDGHDGSHAPQSMRMMTLSKLCESLVHFANMSASIAEGRLAPSRRSRLWSGVTLVRTHLRSLGYLFPVIVIMGAFSSRAALALSQRIFRIASTAYTRRFLECANS